MTAVIDLARAVLDDTREWGEQAACIGLAHVLEGDDVKAAKALCLGDAATGQTRCPVINECHRWAIPLKGKKDPGGVRAGRTEEERNDFRNGRIGRPRATTGKQCPRCREDKKPTEFYRHHAHKDGLSTYCKPCNGAIRAEYHAREVA